MSHAWFSLKDVTVLHGPNFFAARSVLAFWVERTGNQPAPGLWVRCRAELDEVLKVLLGVDFEPLSGGDWSSKEEEALPLYLCRLTLVLQRAIGQKLTLCRSLASGGRAGALVEYQDEATVRGALHLSGTLVAGWFASQKPLPLSELVSRFRGPVDQYVRQAYAHGLDRTTVALVEKAVERGIPWRRLHPHHRLVMLGQGKYQRRLSETVTDRTSGLAVHIQTHKEFTNRLLAELGIPTPHSIVVKDIEQAVRAADKIGYPVVVKPNLLGRGKGVFVKLPDALSVRAAYYKAARFGEVILEKYFPGDDHRLITIAGRLVSASRKTPACVTGDGQSTVRALVDEVNRDPRRGLGFRKPLNQILVDDEVERILAEQNWTLNSVPPAGCVVSVRRTGNVATGATTVDVTEQVHPDNRRLAERAAAAVGLDIAGVDFITTDISRSWREVGGVVLEVNYSSALPVRDLKGLVIDYLFPPGQPASVPTAMVAGNKDAAIVCRMTAAILARAGLHVALATAHGAYLGEEQVFDGDQAGGRTAGQLLIDPAVEAGVFEMSCQNLLKQGMFLDACSVGALLNVQEDIGTEVSLNPEEMAKLKGLLLRHAREWAVVNADDPLCLAQAATMGAKSLCLVSRAGFTGALETHVARGGVAFSTEQHEGQEWIVLHKGDSKTLVVAFQDLSALFAAAIAFGMGMTVAMIRSGLVNLGAEGGK